MFLSIRVAFDELSQALPSMTFGVFSPLSGFGFSVLLLFKGISVFSSFP